MIRKNNSVKDKKLNEKSQEIVQARRKRKNINNIRSIKNISIRTIEKTEVGIKRGKKGPMNVEVTTDTRRNTTRRKRKRKITIADLVQMRKSTASAMIDSLYD